MGTFIVLAVLAVVIFLIIRAMVNNKKQGRSSCGCGCSTCGAKCSHSSKSASEND